VTSELRLKYSPVKKLKQIFFKSLYPPTQILRLIWTDKKNNAQEMLTSKKLSDPAEREKLIAR